MKSWMYTPKRIKVATARVGHGSPIKYLLQEIDIAVHSTCEKARKNFLYYFVVVLSDSFLKQFVVP